MGVSWAEMSEGRETGAGTEPCSCGARLFGPACADTGTSASTPRRLRGPPWCALWARCGCRPGVISWGEGCARPGSQNYYIRLTSHHDWIHRIIPELQFQRGRAGRCPEARTSGWQPLNRTPHAAWLPEPSWSSQPCSLCSESLAQAGGQWPPRSRCTFVNSPPVPPPLQFPLILFMFTLQ